MPSLDQSVTRHVGFDLSGKLLDCTEVLLAGPNAVTCHLKSSEFKSVCSEYELLWVEGNAAPATQV